MMIIKMLGWAETPEQLASLTVAETERQEYDWLQWIGWVFHSMGYIGPGICPVTPRLIARVRWVSELEAVLFPALGAYRCFYGGVIFGFRPIGGWMGFQGVLEVVSAVEGTILTSTSVAPISGESYHILGAAGPTWTGLRFGYDLGGRYGRHVGENKYGVGLGFLGAPYE